MKKITKTRIMGCRALLPRCGLLLSATKMLALKSLLALPVFIPWRAGDSSGAAVAIEYLKMVVQKYHSTSISKMIGAES